MPATPLARERAASQRVVNRDKRPLAANTKVFKGGSASINANGFHVPSSGAAGEIVVGFFYESVDNTGGIDGAKMADVRFTNERTLRLLDNDASALVTVASRERACSVLDDHTATLYTPALGAYGVVYDVTSEGVWVSLGGGVSAAASGAPTIQRGTTTLVAGTKTVSGVTLTANSSIQLTVRDPGAGAIPAFACLDAPVGNRVTGTGTGSFVVNAIDNTKATIATAVCTVDYIIAG